MDRAAARVPHPAALVVMKPAPPILRDPHREDRAGGIGRGPTLALLFVAAALAALLVLPIAGERQRRPAHREIREVA